jgi:hypothetical protein
MIHRRNLPRRERRVGQIRSKLPPAVTHVNAVLNRVEELEAKVRAR